MKNYLKLPVIIGVLGAVAIAAASPSFAAKRHQQNANATQSYGAAQPYEYEGNTGPYVNNGGFGSPSDQTSYEGRVRSEGN